MVRKVISSGVSMVQSSGLNAGDVLNVIGGVSEYKDAREQGDNVVKSATKAGISFAWGEFFYGGMSSAVTNAVEGFGNKFLGGISATKAGMIATPLTIGLALAPAIGQIAGVSMEQNTKVQSKALSQRGKIGSGYFNMSDSGYTMRQRSLNAIRSNGLNTQSVLGNEARTYFRS